MFSGDGAGTIGDPYQITSWAQLDEVRDDLTAYYLLMNNLDSSSPGYSTYNTGSGWLPIDEFNGSFDGGHKTITDLFIDRTGRIYVGLFGDLFAVSGAGATSFKEIKNLGLIDVNLTGNQRYIGALVGDIRGSSARVENCYSTGTVNGSDRCGGLIGQMFDGDYVKNCWSSCTVVSTSTSVGGLIGNFGGASSKVDNCYAVGVITAINSSTGGLFGNAATGTVTNSFWDTQTSGKTVSGAGTGKTTSEMQDIDTYTDTATVGLTTAWDMVDDSVYVDEIWSIDSSVAYPLIGGFNATPAPTPPTVTTQAASSITSTTVTLNGNVTALGDETTVDTAFDYRVVGAGSWTRTTPDTGVTATGAYTKGITGLTAAENYEYSSVVIYNTTEEVYGSEVTFTTAAGPTAPTVTTQAVTDVATTTATGNGNVTTDGGETVTERGVCWSTTTAPTTADSTTTSAGTTGAFTSAITGLTAETLYYVRAYAINSEGTSYGSEVTFTTTEVTVPKYAAYTKIAGDLVRIS